MAHRTVVATMTLAGTFCVAGAIAFADPPGRVGRISFMSGTVSYRPAVATDWAPAALNYPVTVGDHLWTDRMGRLELEAGGTAVNLDTSTAISILNLDENVFQLRVMQGTVIARVHDLAGDESLEIDTPNGAVSLLRPGFYRIDVSPAGDATTVTVRRGDVEVAAGSSAFPVHTGQSAALVGLDSPTHDLLAAVRLDEFEDWVTFRDRRADNPDSVRYVGRGIVGYEDLDEFGTWRLVASYGPIWVPHVRAEWVPYRFGHWAWVEPWGWTWIDDAPWGFAPFHYGRWVFLTDGWAWVPGTIVARPVYAPALVAFIGGSNWRVGISVGQPVGWFPLGPREVFVPAYQVSPVYVAAVNRPHVTVTNINVTVTNVTYVNRTVAGAVTVVPRDTFVQARAVAPAAVAVAPSAVRAAVVVGHTAPTEIGRPQIVRAVAVSAPPAAVVSRPVVVRMPPPQPAAQGAVASPPPVRPALVDRAVVRPSTVQPVTQPPPSPAPPPPPSNPRGAAMTPGSPGPSGQPVPAAPAAVNARTASPDRSAADVVVRHAQERVDVETRHAAERADLEARQREEAQRAAANAQAQAEMKARHDREQADLEARQKREHEQTQQKQETERRRPRNE